MERIIVVEFTYILYLIISIAITMGVARSLSKNGVVFLIDGFVKKTRSKCNDSFIM